MKDSRYFGLDNVILTPHIAGSTGEAQEAVGVQIAMQVKEYLKFGVVQNAVNLPSMTFDEYRAHVRQRRGARIEHRNALAD